MANYFFAYRYMEPRSDNVVDGNIVLGVDNGIRDSADVRNIEEIIANGIGIDAKRLGLTNIVALDD